MLAINFILVIFAVFGVVRASSLECAIVSNLISLSRSLRLCPSLSPL
jgi:hypothetical protein